MVVGCRLPDFVHRDIAALAEELGGHFHLNPARGHPRIFLELSSHISDARLWTLAAFALAYAVLRLVEAYGLWRGRRWAEWLAVGSGGPYVPHELCTGLSAVKRATLAANIAILHVAHALAIARPGDARHRGPGS